MDQFSNRASTTLSAGINNSVTSISVADGSSFPTGQHVVVIENELVLVTSRSGNTLTVVRGTEGTTAASHGIGAEVRHIISAEVAESFFAVPGQCCARLSAHATNPVPATDVTAATTLHLLPFRGNRISLYNGRRWTAHVLGEGGVSLDVTALSHSTLYDVFAYLNAGVITLEAVAWASATARATDLAVQDGVEVKSGATSRLHVGTFYTFNDGGTTKTCDTAGGKGSGGVEAKRFVCNRYNRLPRPCYVADDTDSWTYNTTGTWRAANGSGTARASFVQVDSDYIVDALNIQNFTPSGNAIVGVGVDSTTLPSGASSLWNGPSIAAIPAVWRGHVAAGLHYVSAIEFIMTGSATFYGDVGTGWPVQSGLHVTVWG